MHNIIKDVETKLLKRNSVDNASKIYINILHVKIPSKLKCFSYILL